MLVEPSNNQAARHVRLPPWARHVRPLQHSPGLAHVAPDLLQKLHAPLVMLPVAADLRLPTHAYPKQQPRLFAHDPPRGLHDATARTLNCW
jgi:hypothetical protein